MKRVLRVCAMLMILVCLCSISAYGEETNGKTMEMYLSNNGDGSWALDDDCPDDVVMISSYSFDADDLPAGEIVYCFEIRGISPGREYVILKWIRNGEVYMYMDLEFLVDDDLQPSVIHCELVSGVNWIDENWTGIEPNEVDDEV